MTPRWCERLARSFKIIKANSIELALAFIVLHFVLQNP